MSEFAGMSLSTLPAESVSAITQWLRNQPVGRRLERDLEARDDRQKDSSRGAEQFREQSVIPTRKSRRPNVLLKTLQSLQSSNQRRRPTADTPTKSEETPLRRTQLNPGEKSPSAPQRKTEHIDPLPDFDIGCLLDRDHCVFVGNLGRTRSADGPPLTPSASAATEALIDDLSLPVQSPPQALDQESPVVPSKSASSQGMDRRAYPRRDSDGIVSVCLRAASNRLFQRSPDISWKLHATALRGRLIDVSMTGMAFSLSEPLPEGAPVSLQVTSRSLDAPAQITGYVLRCTPTEEKDIEGNDQWRLVCQLDGRLSFEQVHSLGKQMFAYTMV